MEILESILVGAAWFAIGYTVTVIIIKIMDRG